MSKQSTLDVLLDTISHRRSVRRYLPESIPRAHIEQIIRAAAWAPSAHNRQPWRFAIIDSAEQIHSLADAMGARLRDDLRRESIPADVIERDAARSYARITSAPVVVVVCLTMADMDTYPDTRRSQNETVMAVQSVAMSGQNLLLAAHSAGLGACWMCAPLFCPDVVRDVLDLPPDWQPQGLITLGYPAETRTKDRRSLDEIILWR